MKALILAATVIVFSPVDALAQRVERRLVEQHMVSLHQTGTTSIRSDYTGNIFGYDASGPRSVTSASDGDGTVLIGAAIGATAGALFFSGMAGLGDRQADARDYIVGAMIGAALGASLTLLAQHASD